MSEKEFYKLDKYVVDFWLSYNNISLNDICKHFTEESMTLGEFSKNFDKIMKGKKVRKFPSWTRHITRYTNNKWILENYKWKRVKMR